MQTIIWHGAYGASPFFFSDLSLSRRIVIKRDDTKKTVIKNGATE